MPMSITSANNVDATSGGGDKARCAYIPVTYCPLCHHALRPEILSAHYVPRDAFVGESYSLYITCFCVLCRRPFLVEYEGSREAYESGIDLRFGYPVSVVPTFPAENAFSADIQALSPGFSETYAQAATAEDQQLFQICGAGYRRALEFLVKDYLCHKYPEQAERVRAELLSASIRRIDNDRIRVLADRSAWIGNDEVHYIRRREDLSLNDMKRFIKAALTYIESELAFEDAESISRI